MIKMDVLIQKCIRPFFTYFPNGLIIFLTVGQQNKWCFDNNKASIKMLSTIIRMAINNSCKALRKTEISKFFMFASFGIVRLPKFGIFLEKPGFSKFAKISQKKFRNKFGSKPPVFGSKTLFLGQKEWLLVYPTLKYCKTVSSFVVLLLQAFGLYVNWSPKMKPIENWSFVHAKSFANA